jgi:hypothetical protein
MNFHKWRVLGIIAVQLVVNPNLEVRSSGKVSGRHCIPICRIDLCRIHLQMQHMFLISPELKNGLVWKVKQKRIFGICSLLIWSPEHLKFK